MLTSNHLPMLGTPANGEPCNTAEREYRRGISQGASSHMARAFAKQKPAERRTLRRYEAAELADGFLLHFDDATPAEAWAVACAAEELDQESQWAWGEFATAGQATFGPVPGNLVALPGDVEEYLDELSVDDELALFLGWDDAPAEPVTVLSRPMVRSEVGLDEDVLAEHGVSTYQELAHITRNGPATTQDVYGSSFDPHEVGWGFTVSDRPVGSHGGNGPRKAAARDEAGRWLAEAEAALAGAA